MLDKNGKEIKVGDVVQMDDGSTGTVSKVTADYYICEYWSDGYGSGNHMQISSYVEIIKTVTEQETFTKEDEELLQKLTNKKAQALEAEMNAEEDFTDLRVELYNAGRLNNMKHYLTENIDKICDTLQTYKKHCVK